MIGNIKALTFDDVLLVPGYNGIKSRQDVSLGIKVSDKEFEIPIASSNMDSVTGLEMAQLLSKEGGLPILHRFQSIEDNVKMLQACDEPSRVGFSIGIGDTGLERAEALVSAGGEIVCVDVAHGHSKSVNRTIKALRESYKGNLLIIAGNVASYAGADYLAAAGADIIKVGIGNGSVCTTRIKTGYGVPQLFALQDCSRVDRAIIADGGMKTPGDIVKAIAAGADMAMLGGMLAGTEETPGQVIEKKTEDGRSVRIKNYRGMASREAQEDFMGQMAGWKTAEGVSIEVPCKGSAKEVFADILGGLRSGLTYCGAATITDLQRKAQFVEITQAGKIESSPHAVGRLNIF